MDINLFVACLAVSYFVVFAAGFFVGQRDRKNMEAVK